MENAKLKWNPPQAPSIKMNVAWKVMQARKSVEVGVVVWDISGVLLAAFCEEVPIPSGPIQTDAQSLLKALAFA